MIKTNFQKHAQGAAKRRRWEGPLAANHLGVGLLRRMLKALAAVRRQLDTPAREKRACCAMGHLLVLKLGVCHAPLQPSRLYTV
jgi:hypothetical protein